MSANLSWLEQAFPDLSSIARLNDGGQKWVFSAIHATDGDVVLKLIQPGQDAERIRREISAVNQVATDRVAKIFAQGTVLTQIGELLWIREQRISGRTVREVLSAGPLGRDSLINLGQQILGALVAAENVRIVHRDVKPDNIMLDDSGNFWLLDFGLSRHLGLESVTATAAYWGVGTAGYAPPEQFRNQKADIDARADLFGLGVTLHESAIGYNTFRQGARDQLEIIRRVERQPLPRLKLEWDADGAFADFVTTLTQPLRTLRVSTAREARDWFDEVASRHS